MPPWHTIERGLNGPRPASSSAGDGGSTVDGKSADALNSALSVRCPGAIGINAGSFSAGVVMSRNRG